MIVNKNTLLKKAPIKNMETTKKRSATTLTSYGLVEAGYDIRLKQHIRVKRSAFGDLQLYIDGVKQHGSFGLISSIEEFDMPANLVGMVFNKSTLSRLGFSIAPAVVEPGWKGYLTLELMYNGNDELELPPGIGVAQVLFSTLSDPVEYDGKYQHQTDGITHAIKG